MTSLRCFVGFDGGALDGNLDGALLACILGALTIAVQVSSNVLRGRWLIVNAVGGGGGEGGEGEKRKVSADSPTLVIGKGIHVEFHVWVYAAEG